MHVTVIQPFEIHKYNLTPNDTMVYGLICSMEHHRLGFYATNDYIKKFIETSTSAINESLRRLEASKLIIRKYTANNKRYIQTQHPLGILKNKTGSSTTCFHQKSRIETINKKIHKKNKKITHIKVNFELLKDMGLTNLEKYIYSFLCGSENKKKGCVMTCKEIGKFLYSSESKIYVTLNKLASKQLISFYSIKNSRTKIIRTKHPYGIRKHKNGTVTIYNEKSKMYEIKDNDMTKNKVEHNLSRVEQLDKDDQKRIERRRKHYEKRRLESNTVNNLELLNPPKDTKKLDKDPNALFKTNTNNKPYGLENKKTTTHSSSFTLHSKENKHTMISKQKTTTKIHQSYPTDSIPEKITKAYSKFALELIVKTWNSHKKRGNVWKGCKKLTLILTKTLKKYYAQHTIDEFISAIDNYALVLLNEKYFYNYSWDITAFFTRWDDRSINIRKWMYFADDCFDEDGFLSYATRSAMHYKKLEDSPDIDTTKQIIQGFKLKTKNPNFEPDAKEMDDFIKATETMIDKFSYTKMITEERVKYLLGCLDREVDMGRRERIETGSLHTHYTWDRILPTYLAKRGHIMKKKKS